MSKAQKKQYKSVRMFENDWLERLSHVHPITPMIVWVPVVAWLAWHGHDARGVGILESLLLALFGLFVWTFAEYILHRYIFHFQNGNRFVERLHFIIHGNHHEVTDDPTRLVMPPVAAIAIAAVLFVLFRAILGPASVEPFFAGFLVGYLCYDYTHYYVHHFTPKTKVGRYLKQYHMLHHFAGHHSRWGVSSPLWDFVFGTMEEAGRKRPVRHGSS
jgi:sterol desaturase/sphingolipid hydroxylase (fatty acid hydroxylase superfamily)